MNKESYTVATSKGDLTITPEGDVPAFRLMGLEMDTEQLEEEGRICRWCGCWVNKTEEMNICICPCHQKGTHTEAKYINAFRDVFGDSLKAHTPVGETWTK